MEQLIKREGITCPFCGIYVPFREGLAAELRHAIIKTNGHVSIVCPHRNGSKPFAVIRASIYVRVNHAE